LTKEEDDKWEDRASLGTFSAHDGVYMSFPATLRVPGHFMTEVSAGELEEVA
jgi:hypothetical protein